MATEIFGRKKLDIAGSFSADDAEMTFTGLDAGGDVLGLAITRSSWNYQQSYAQVYDITQNQVYVVRGRAQGQGTFGQMAGPRPLTKKFMETYGDVCTMQKNSLTFTTKAGCSTDPRTDSYSRESFTAQYVLLSGIGQDVNGQDMMINRTIPFSFVALMMDGGGPSLTDGAIGV